MIRRFGAPPKRNQSYRHRPGAYVILPRGRQILATYQGGQHREFQLPGGGIEPGEAPIPALHREVMEETGWIMGRPRKIGVHRRFTYMPEYDTWAEKLCHIYVARPVQCLCRPTEPEHEPAWIDAQHAVDLLATPGDAAFVARWFRLEYRPRPDRS